MNKRRSSSPPRCPQPNHGFGIGLHVETVSEGLLRMEGGSLYPALPPPGKGQGGEGRLAADREQPPRPSLHADVKYEVCNDWPDACGHCLNSSVLFSSDIALNETQIFFLAIKNNVPLLTVQQTILAHELGHAMNLDHAPLVTACGGNLVLMNQLAIHFCSAARTCLLPATPRHCVSCTLRRMAPAAIVAIAFSVLPAKNESRNIMM